MGQPKKQFYESSDETKTIKVQEIVITFILTKITYVAQVNLRSTGRGDATYCVKEAVGTTPSRANQIKKTHEKSTDTKNLLSYSNYEILALFVDLKLTKIQCHMLHISANN